MRHTWDRLELFSFGTSFPRPNPTWPVLTCRGPDIKGRPLISVYAHSIVETIRHPLLVLDDKLKIQSANSAFCRAFNMSKTDAKGCSLYDLDRGSWDLPRLRSLLEEVRQGGSFEDFEIRQEFPRLGQRVMLLNARPLVRGENELMMILLGIEDVTERVHAREDLSRLNLGLEDRVRERTGELEATNKELEAFCYSISHDLRAPLRALDGFSNELLENYGGRFDAKGTHYLRRLREGSKRMGQLIDDLLKLSRLSRGEMRRERVDLSSLADAIVVELRQQSPDRRVSFEIQPGLIGEGDSGLLKIVLENLLNNAWKFTSKKLSATISMGQTEHQGCSAFFVRDDGAGFDMNYASKLFGAFQRLHPQQEFPGNGIGLASVQRTIHRHGGQVWAEAEPAKGATFYFTLPTKESP
jgi:PAS domain S-box-containing protein